jgi:eukaryotic-like serine/threonine-protein kinase
VLLYELLTGVTPFDARDLLAMDFDTMRRTIRETEPPPPSARLLQASTANRPDSTSNAPFTVSQRRRRQDLAQQLRGDLDWIVMKCLEKDRSRRYPTANGVAADLQRHLDNEPVTARPPTTLYRFKKAWRRNRLAFTAFTSIAATLVAGAAFSTWLMLLALQSERAAEAARLDEQRQRLEAQRAQRTAENQQARADDQTRQTEQREEYVRRLLYASDISLAQQALRQGNLSKTRRLLDRHRPTPGSEDLRGWEWRYLWQECQGDPLHLLCEFTTEIRALAASPDSRWIAVHASDGEGPSIWDLRTHQPVVRLPGSEKVSGGAACGAAFSPDGSLFAYGEWLDSSNAGSQGMVALWDLRTRKVTARLPLEGRCIHLVFSRDGKRLLSYSQLQGQGPPAGEITVWELAERRQIMRAPLAVWVRQEGPALNVSSDLSRIAYYTMTDNSLSQRVRIMDLTTGEERTTDAHHNMIQTVALSPDAEILAVATSNPGKTIRLWDLNLMQPIGELEGHQLWCNALVFWPDGSTLASASADGTIRLWDMAEMRPIGAPLRGHGCQVWQLVLLPDERTLISGGSDGAVLVWDVVDLLARRSDVAPTASLARGRFTPDNLVPRTNEWFYGRASFWRFTPDSQAMFTCNYGGRVIRWSGRDYSDGAHWLEVGDGSFQAFISEDCRWLATSATDGVIQIWDLDQRVQRGQLPPLPGRVLSEWFLGDGRRLAVRHRDKDSMQEWDLASGKIVQSWSWQGSGQPRPGVIRPFAFSPDERYCLTLDWGGIARLTERGGGHEVLLPLGMTRPSAAMYSSDGRFLAVANQWDLVKLWRAEPLQELATLRGFHMGINALAFSPDNRRLVVTSRYGDAVKIFDVMTGQELLTIEEPGGVLAPVAFSPDGNVLAGVNDQLDRIVWRTPSWAEIEAVENPEDHGRRPEPSQY